MAGFFYLSGLFSARSARRKLWGAFALDKIVRLGVPAAGYSVVGDAGAQLILGLWAGGVAGGWGALRAYGGATRVFQGPVWYCATLLVLDLLYLPAQQVWALLPKMSVFQARCAEDNVALFLILDVAASFLLRVIYAVFLPLNLQVGFAPQYVAAYLCGRASTMAIPNFISKVPALGCCHS